jgi:hypothetical protein
MRVKELSRGTEGAEEYALVVTRSISAEDPFEAELPEVRDAIRRWHASREAAARTLTFSYVAAPADFDRLTEDTAEFVSSLVDELPFVEQLRVQLVFVDADTQEVSTITLEWGDADP